MRELREAKKSNRPDEPGGPAPGPSVFDKRGYMHELQGRADAARKEFEVAVKVQLLMIYSSNHELWG